jgi:hypothetical protein
MTRLLIAALGITALASAAPVPKEADKPPLYFPTRVGDTRVWAWVDDKNEFTEVVTTVENLLGPTAESARVQPEHASSRVACEEGPEVPLANPEPSFHRNGRSSRRLVYGEGGRAGVPGGRLGQGREGGGGSG